MKPPELWPDLSTLEPFWESFQAFARSELGDRGEVEDIRSEVVQNSDGSWQFRAETRVDRQRTEPSGEQYTQTLVYDPDTDEMEFTDNRDGSTWVMEDAFGDPYSASSKS
jgi:hypothetical protein